MLVFQNSKMAVSMDITIILLKVGFNIDSEINQKVGISFLFLRKFPEFEELVQTLITDVSKHNFCPAYAIGIKIWLQTSLIKIE